MKAAPRNIAVIGAGNMGTTLANLLANNGHTVRIWDINHDILDEIAASHSNSRYLPGARLSSKLKPFRDIVECIANTDMIIVVVPSKFVRQTVRLFAKNIADGQIILNCAKGIEEDSHKFMAEVIEDEIGSRFHHQIADLSGPSLAKEVAAGMMTRVTVVSKNQCILPQIKQAFEDGNDFFRVIVLMDTVGVQLGGMMKNIYAIAVGICDGVQESENTKAFVLDSSLSEMAKLGEAMGAYRETFYGLSGVGDLIATCFSENSRNRTLGKKLGSGKSLADAQAEMQQVTEGVPATKIIHELSQKYAVHLPIAEEMYKVLYEGKPAREAVRELIKIVL